MVAQSPVNIPKLFVDRGGCSARLNCPLEGGLRCFVLRAAEVDPPEDAQCFWIFRMLSDRALREVAGSIQCTVALSEASRVMYECLSLIGGQRQSGLEGSMSSIYIAEFDVRLTDTRV